ncbi:hypothetical protein, partial [Xanthomonas fragariae]
ALRRLHDPDAWKCSHPLSKFITRSNPIIPDFGLRHRPSVDGVAINGLYGLANSGSVWRHGAAYGAGVLFILAVFAEAQTFRQLQIFPFFIDPEPARNS